MPVATPMEGNGGTPGFSANPTPTLAGRVTADSLAGGRVSFTTVNSGAESTTIPDIAPPRIAQPQAHEAKVLVWTDLTLHEVDTLEATRSTVALQDAIAEMFDLKDYESNLRSAVLLDLYFYTIQFAKDNDFSKEQISASFSIVKRTFEVCIETPFGNLDHCYNYFKDLVMCHSVKRPPFSLDIFPPPMAKKLTDYVINTFFRHFKLYKYCFTPKVRLDLAINYVGTPVTPPPLITTLKEKSTKTPGEQKEDQGESELPKEEDHEDKPAEVATADLPPAQRELRRLIEAQLTEQLADLRTNLECQIKAADETLQGKLAAVEAEFGIGRRGKRK